MADAHKPGTHKPDDHGADARERRFDGAAALTEALAADIAAALQAGLAAGRGASLLVPGGHTPVRLFERLSRVELDWASVWVGLTDERWVDPHSSASNERLVREHLLRNEAAGASFVGLKTAATTAQRAQSDSWSTLAEVPRPFDFVLLGMGDDGHVASLFPGSPGLVQALDPAGPPGCVQMSAPVPPLERMSLNLRALLDSRRIALLITGADKWATYQRARARGPAAQMPVRALLAQQNVPLSIYWAP
ncbi:MAG TPA: 6-phosphogluconolactonase [Steroidobacteraceae bacterium]|jgi:6-phosphogluconolactonase|nr:6-phosphogluconolactonase [Steroidobacteraceae bacterium]